MKVFDTDAKRCNDCPFLKGNDTCTKLNRLEMKNKLVHSDCPFKYKNSFTDEQFQIIGFSKSNDNKFYTKSII